MSHTNIATNMLQKEIQFLSEELQIRDMQICCLNEELKFYKRSDYTTLIKKWIVGHLGGKQTVK